MSIVVLSVKKRREFFGLPLQETRRTAGSALRFTLCRGEECVGKSVFLATMRGTSSFPDTDANQERGARGHQSILITKKTPEPT